jgi:hypothetical protein
MPENLASPAESLHAANNRSIGLHNYIRDSARTIFSLHVYYPSSGEVNEFWAEASNARFNYGFFRV